MHFSFTVFNAVCNLDTSSMKSIIILGRVVTFEIQKLQDA